MKFKQVGINSELILTQLSGNHHQLKYFYELECSIVFRCLCKRGTNCLFNPSLETTGQNICLKSLPYGSGRAWTLANLTLQGKAISPPEMKKCVNLNRSLAPCRSHCESWAFKEGRSSSVAQESQLRVKMNHLGCHNCVLSCTPTD